MLNIILGMIVIILLIHIKSLKKQIKSMTNQINEYDIDTNVKNIDIKLIDRDLEHLAYSINNHLKNTQRISINKKVAEENLKQSIANISHDLRTPLTSISGYIQMIENEKLSEKQRIEYINIIKERCIRLEELLNEFFKLSLIELDSYELNIQRANLNDIIYEIIASFYEDFVNKNITPNIIVVDEDINVEVDIQEFKRVIENIISNNIKYSKSNIDIIIKKEPKYSKIEIVEYNTDLNEDDVDNMFNRFYKKDKSRTTTSTGLGLFIAKTLMKKMNGDIIGTLNQDKFTISCILNTVEDKAHI